MFNRYSFTGRMDENCRSDQRNDLEAIVQTPPTHCLQWTVKHVDGEEFQGGSCVGSC